MVHSITVSCKSGYHIKDLRDKIFDIISQKKEIHRMLAGCGVGRIPMDRLLMDQLVPAFHHQLEKIVKNIAMSIKSQGKSPFLTYKELR